MPRRFRRATGFHVYLAIGSFLLIGATAIKLVWDGSARKSTEIESPRYVANGFDFVELPVPLSEVERGAPLGSVEYATVSWSRANSPDSYVQNIEQFKNARAIMTLASRVPIPLSSVTTGDMDTNALIEKIPEGMRAITVAVNEETAVEGWAQSGTYVDVISLSADSKDGKLAARVIAENVKILSAGRSLVPSAVGDTAPRAPTTVTILCNQKDALKIKMAAKVGSITFSLRGVVDSEPTRVVTLNENTLHGGLEHNASPSSRYVGEAKGPDGSVYYLRKGDYKWVKRGAAVEAVDSPEASQP
ncbi:MAG: Flp pilus assembly protein CpaB [Deltaproteobacteria bacterium]|nr:Flp pilus assembly protein CpaB [Deltaproteobacteria bacterium]